MNEALAQLSVGGIFAILVIRETLNFVRPIIRKRNGKPESKIQVECLHSSNIIQAFRDGLRGHESETLERFGPVITQVDELHRWHSKTDASGAFAWYGDKATLKDIKEAIQEQTQKQTEHYIRMQMTLKEIAKNGNGKD